MEQEIMLIVRDSHIADGKKDGYEITTKGRFSGDENDYTLEYDEMIEEFKGCRTTVRVTDGKYVCVTRHGHYNMDLTVEKGKRHDCLYVTPFGSCMMSVFGSKIESSVKDGEGSLIMNYAVDIYGDTASVTDLTFIFNRRKCS
ncbi:MAG: DUF1934 domain-containing protein [Clostridiales bacterium]|nr:DUF1934 domain-containing protein [Clostridiales bacterium]